MTDREKLIEIYNKLEEEGLACISGKGAMADLMIANGVTVQEWISVKDRLPNGKKVIDGEEYIKNVAVRIKDDAPEKIAFYDDEEKCWFDTEFFPIAGEVTHWCELPPNRQRGNNNVRL